MTNVRDTKWGIDADSIQISVAIITFNEASGIRRCIESVHDWADEVFILDSFSTDDTKNICLSFPKVRFETHPFDGHIQQKNRALERCRGHWVLSIDADECVTPELAQSIVRFVESSPQATGARVKRLTWHMNRFIRHGGWYPNARYRLVQRGKARWGGENPHDTLLIDGESGPTLDGDLIHYSFIDLTDQVQTINKFSSIVAHTRFKKRKRFRPYRLILKPLSKLIELYVIKRGFLDGMQGWIIAVSSAYSSFLKEAKLYEMDRLGLQRPSNLPPHYEQED